MAQKKELETVLYRKYRPKSFSDVLGQEHVVSVLESALKNKNISHAYLFFGSRGTGKTSIARIFADELGVSPNDLYEIDAASNRGIDDVRALRDAVNTLPFESQYKVYIVDEVHMLTKEAFNALLKTLEEPPSHVIFILATTEIDKLPETVISRCEVHTFRKPNQQILRELVQNIAKKEGHSLDPASAELIAILGDGSFRDTHGILQKVLGASVGKKITEEEVFKITGAPKSSLVYDFIECVDSGDEEKGLTSIEDALEANIDMKVFLKLILQRMRLIMLVKYAPGMHEKIKLEVGDDNFKKIKEFADNKESKINSNSLLVLLEAYSNIGKTYLPQLPLELAVIKVREK